MNVVEFTSPAGRPLSAVGAVEVLTMDRSSEIGARFDRDPRIASIAVVPSEVDSAHFAPATRPAGIAVVAARDLDDVLGSGPETGEVETIVSWSDAASRRGFFHEWWLHPGRDLRRYPYIIEVAAADATEQRDISSALADSMPVHVANLSIAVDATWLGPHQTGAQVLTTEAVRALACHPEVERIVMSGLSELPSYAADLATLQKVEVTNEPFDTTDIYWFPNQWDHRNSSIGDAARRVITTYLDFIAYGIDSYHGTQQDWIDYRALQRSVALASDGVTTISRDVAQQLLDNVPLMDSKRVRAIPLGVDHVSLDEGQAQRPEELPDELRPFLLVLGNDFRHKNRDFAIKVWKQVLDSGISCDLVLAGLHVRGSSSRQAENELLSSHVNLRGDVHMLGHVDEGARLWLLANASVVLYPSSAEGFGFVPFEAASLGTPTSFVSFGSLRELASAEGLPKSWSVDAFTNDAVSMLTNPQAAAQRVEQIQASSRSLRWSQFAEEFVDFSRSILQLPRHVGASSMNMAGVENGSSRGRSRRPVSGVVRRLRRWNQ